MLTFVDSAKSSVVHLIRAVEDNDVLSEAAAHVLDGLCFSSPGRAGRGTSKRHAQGLSQGDVASADSKDSHVAMLHLHHYQYCNAAKASTASSMATFEQDALPDFSYCIPLTLKKKINAEKTTNASSMAISETRHLIKL